jgi:hypothetical protein
MIHLHSSEQGFCGDKSVGRRFSLEVSEVTCPCCIQQRASEVALLNAKFADLNAKFAVLSKLIAA